jgi:DNA-binding NarL/FixJ family response regulator
MPNPKSRTPIPSPPRPVLTLSARERQVIALFAAGHSNKTAAQALGLKTVSVKQYARNIYRKLGVVNRTAAVVWAIQNTSCVPLTVALLRMPALE